MSRCEFDRDAITLSPPELRQLLQKAGFEIVLTDYLFLFPNFLSPFRFLESISTDFHSAHSIWFWDESPQLLN